MVLYLPLFILGFLDFALLFFPLFSSDHKYWKLETCNMAGISHTMELWPWDVTDMIWFLQWQCWPGPSATVFSMAEQEREGQLIDILLNQGGSLVEHMTWLEDSNVHQAHTALLQVYPTLIGIPWGNLVFTQRNFFTSRQLWATDGAKPNDTAKYVVKKTEPILRGMAGEGTGDWSMNVHKPNNVESKIC